MTAARAIARELLPEARRQARRGKPRLLAELLAFLRPQKISYTHHHTVKHELRVADVLTLEKKGSHEPPPAARGTVQ